MFKRISTLIAKFTGLSTAEIGQASIFQLILFLLITTLLLLKPTINSVFISALGSQALPIGYVFTAFVAYLGSYLYQNAVDRLQLKDLVSSSLLGTIVIILGFGVLLNLVTPGPILLYALYVFVAIYGLLTTSQFWLAANSIYSVRQAKRLFGYIGAGGIVGGIFGGYLTSLLSKLMPVEDILFVAAGLLFICVWLYRSLWKDATVEQNKTLPSKNEDSNPIHLLKQSKLLYFIAIMTGLSVFAAKLVDYQYSDFAHKMTDSPEQLSSFFGIWLSNISLISLVIQLFLTKVILKRLGVSNSLFIMPGGLLLGSVLLILVPELWVAIFIKLVDGSLKQSTNKSAREMIFMPIPYDLRRRTKSFIDVVVDSVATGLAGIVLYLVINNLNLSTVSISLVTIIFIISWLYYIFKVKGAYKDSYRELAGLSYYPPEEVTPLAKPKISSIEEVQEIINSGENDKIEDLLNQMDGNDRSDLTPELIGLLDSNNEAIVTKTCKLLSCDANDWSEQLKPLISSENLATATYATDGVLDHKSPQERDEIIKANLSGEVNKDYLIALRILAEDVGFDKINKANSNIAEYVEKTDQSYKENPDSQMAAQELDTIIRVAGMTGLEQYYPYLKENLYNPLNETVLESSIEFAPVLNDESVSDQLVQYVADPKYKTVALKALQNFGDKGLQYIMDQTKEGNPVYDNNLELPEIIANFGSKKALKALFALSHDASFSMSVEIVKELNKLNREYHIKIPKDFIDRNLKRLYQLYRETVSSLYSIEKLLASELTPEIRDALLVVQNELLAIKNRPKQFLPSLLSLTYKDSELQGIEEIFRDGDKTRINNVIEYLDEIFDTTRRIYVEPLLLTETCEDSQVDCEFKMVDGESLSLKQMIQGLMRRNNTSLRMALLQLINKQGDKDYLSLVEPFAKSQNQSIQSQARDVMSNLA